MSASRRCEMCTSATPSPAVVFCDADACYLCAACDEDVHQANRLAQRHRRRPVTALDDQPASEHADALVPDVDSAALDCDGSANDAAAAAIVADGGYADFDFDSHFEKMPALDAAGEDSMFESLVPDHGGMKMFDSDLSWESVVSDDFEHVVPDIEPMSMVPVAAKAQPVRAAVVKSEPTVGRSSYPACPADLVVSSSARCPPSVPFKKVALKLSSPAISKMSGSSSTSAFSKVTSYAPSYTSSPRSVVKPSPTTVSRTDAADQAPESEVKTVEERRQIRAEALVRFRAKRANRSFRKKIRYGCRKLLAEKRPRHKGRFVKACDLPLYALHGANYVHYKDALART